MIGLIRYSTDRGRGQGQTEMVCGVSVLTCVLYENGKGEERRLRKLEQLLLRSSVSRVILPESFPHRTLLERLRPVDPMPLYRAAADLLVLKLLDSKGVPPSEAAAVLAGPRLCPELCAAAHLLCPTVRRLRIDVPGEEGADFSRDLRRKFGIAMLPPTADADVTAVFGPTCGAADLKLYGSSQIRMSANGIEPPEGIEQPVLQLLWERGRIRREDLRVINIP